MKVNYIFHNLRYGRDLEYYLTPVNGPYYWRVIFKSSGGIRDLLQLAVL